MDGAIINAAGYSQHSIAIHDVIKAVPFPTVEVHISNIAARDSLHEADVIMPAAKGTHNGEPQSVSDAQLQQAAKIVQAARLNLGAAAGNPALADAHLANALQELQTALKIN